MYTYIYICMYIYILEGAVSYAEDVYNLMVEAYDCVHPVVQGNTCLYVCMHIRIHEYSCMCMYVDSVILHLIQSRYRIVISILGIAC
jgi:hypothetical protein